MKTTLPRLVDALVKCPNYRFCLLTILFHAKEWDTELEDDEVVEVVYKDIALSFTRDMITMVNCNTNNCVDLTVNCPALEIFKGVI